MNLKVKIYLEDENNKFMGIGVLWLLQKVEEKGSLRSAAQDLEISYSKAYTMVKNLEKALDKPILIRKRGGRDREGASLTEYAKDFMNLYDTFQRNCKQLLEEPFEQFKKSLKKLN